MNKKLRRLLALVLAFALCLAYIPQVAFAADPIGTGKIEVSLDYLGKTNETAKGLPADSPVAMPTKFDVNDIVWFGIKVKGMNQSNWDTLQNYGVRMMTLGANYDSEYIAPYTGTAYGGMAFHTPAVKFSNGVKAGSIGDDSTTAKWITAYALDANLLLDVAMSTDYPEPTTLTSEDNAKSFVATIAEDRATPVEYQRFYKSSSSDDQYILRFPMQIKKELVKGRNIIELALAHDAFVIAITDPAQNGDDGQPGKDDATLSGAWYGPTFNEASLVNTNLKKVFKYTGSPDLTANYPAGPIGGTVTIDNTTPTYGDTLTASVTLTSGSNPTYQWYRGTTAISGATGSTYKLAPADVGQQINVKVAATGAEGELEATDKTAAVAKKEVEAGSFEIADKVFDNTTTALFEGGAAGAPQLTGLVNAGEARLKPTEAAFENESVGTDKTVTVKMVLDGTAKDAYTLKNANAEGILTVTKTADIKTKAITMKDIAAVHTKIGATNAKITPAGFNDEISGAAAGATYTYTLADAGTTGITVDNSGNISAPTGQGTATVTVTATLPNNSNYTFGADGTATTTATKTVTINVADKSAESIAVKTQPTKKEYEVGQTLDLTGLVVTVTYDDNSTEDVSVDDFAAKGITATPANGEEATLAMNGKPIVISMSGCDPKNTDNLTVTTAATRVTLKNTPSKYTKAYDGTTAVKVADWATAPEFESNNGTVDASDAVYTLAQAGVGDEINITVTGLKVDGQAAAFDGVVAKGEITIADATLTLGNLDQTVGSIDEVTATLNPADETATVEVKYEVITKAAKAEDTEAGTPAVEEEKDFYAWGPVTVEGQETTVEAYLKGLPAGTKVNVKAASTGATNTNPADATGVLNINARPSGGGGSSAITVTFRAGTNGKITDGKASVSVNRNAKLTSANVPTVTANDGYKFLGWSLDGENVVDPTKDAVTKSITYTALYEATKGGHDAYMFGYADGTFQPNANITRAEAAALMARLNAEYDLTANYTGNLKDVVAGQWYTKVINFNVEKGLITGYTDGTFKPNNAITRQEFCTIVAKYLGLENTGSANFNDTKGVYAEGYIAQLVEKGIVSGYNDGSFKPNANITRAEATRILNGVFDRTPNKETVDAHIAEYNVNLKDVPATHWAYYEILEAALEHTPADFHK